MIKRAASFSQNFAQNCWVVFQLVGAWQEASKDLHALLDLLADHKVAALGLGRGREATKNERAQMLSGYRRTLSKTAARANSGCLLGRLAKVGEAAGGEETESSLASPCPVQGRGVICYAV